jgi:hypothetical protein
MRSAIVLESNLFDDDADVLNVACCSCGDQLIFWTVALVL